MWDEFDPIDPGEPLVPKHEPIEITPGRPPDSKPLELKPSAPRKFDADAPELNEPELNLEGSDGRKPPNVRTMNGYEWPERQMSSGKWTFPLKSVDEISCYMSFRGQKGNYPVGRKWGILVSQEGYEKYASALKINNPKLLWRECCQAAWGVIISQQANHFLVDRAVATLEAAIEVNSRESQYLWRIFRKLHQSSYSALEESSACAYSLRNANRSHAKHYKVLLDHQPDGYKICSSDGKKIKSDPELSHQQAVSRLVMRTQAMNIPLSKSKNFIKSAKQRGGRLYLSQRHSTHTVMQGALASSMATFRHLTRVHMAPNSHLRVFQQKRLAFATMCAI